MASSNLGGARPGAGRKPTGLKTKYYTISLPQDEAELLEKHAMECGKTINKYLRDLIRLGGQYGNVNIDGLHVDEQQKKKNTDLREKTFEEAFGKKSDCFESPYSIDHSEALRAAEEVKPYDRDN